ncbi:MAG: hypothetical protein U0736_24785 [Gemmataceae bacterium]
MLIGHPPRENRTLANDLATITATWPRDQHHRDGVREALPPREHHRVPGAWTPPWRPSSTAAWTSTRPAGSATPEQSWSAADRRDRIQRRRPLLAVGLVGSSAAAVAADRADLPQRWA